MKHPFSIMKHKENNPDIQRSTLNHLAVGACGIVVEVNDMGAMGQRLHDIGILEGTPVVCVGESPMRDPRAYLVRGCIMALRQKDGDGITVQEVKTYDAS